MSTVRSASVMALLGTLAAKCCRSLLSKPCKGLFCGVLRPSWIQGRIGAKRHLLSEDVIKLEDFQQRKLAVAHLVTGSDGNYIELFRKKMQQNKLILRDDLKLLLHLCQKPDDMLVAREAIYRYHAENRNFLYGDFRFGPLFMRLCYELGMEEMAAATLTDKNMKGFFIDSTSFNIAINMLFVKGSYESAMDVFRTMRSQGVPFNKDTLTLAIATCYKLNTAECYKISMSLIEEQQTRGQVVTRHAYCFAIALALRQNDLEKAHTLYTQIMSTDSKLCQNFNVLILTMSGDVLEAVSVLSAAMSPSLSFLVKKPEFSQEVVDLLLLRSEGRPFKMKVEQVVTQLQQAGQVTQETLDDMLCRVPTGKRKPIVMNVMRRTSRRTLRSLQSNLLSE
ncbi:pentatricopeptide repeat-containing protein 2, mitochondrial [Poeciliopsis prolifica]|uniref:pentatricopeptide repeat-containing protein 2, mitochondrial n=1 Tax=Poeciliopsis prolifica TaxID=188132 RepID=UPI00241305D0|nr:pentatricopeptide repeat-containing protein 2, mitochondrial [Poeciliopsis prolifica]